VSNESLPRFLRVAEVAARDAGYSEKTAKGTIYRLIKSSGIQNNAQPVVKPIEISREEIIGTLIGQMRGDLAWVLPQSPITKRASELGISHLVKKLKTKTRSIPQENGIREHLRRQRVCHPFRAARPCLGSRSVLRTCPWLPSLRACWRGNPQ
jgi:hypothetical protein